VGPRKKGKNPPVPVPPPAAIVAHEDESEIARLRTALFDATQALGGASAAIKGHQDDYHHRSDETLAWVERAIKAAKEALGHRGQ
jgi:hypothetical protein